MNDTQKIKLVKDDREIITSVFFQVVLLAVICYATDPRVASKVDEFVNKQRQRIYHRISVWSSLTAIRALPETQDKS